MRTVEKMHGNLIATTTQAADAALAPISTTMMRQLSEMLAQAQEQLSAIQDNVVQLSM